MTKTDVVIICAFYLIVMFAIGGFEWVNYVKDLVAICTILLTGNEDQKETREI